MDSLYYRKVVCYSSYENCLKHYEDCIEKYPGELSYGRILLIGGKIENFFDVIERSNMVSEVYFFEDEEKMNIFVSSLNLKKEKNEN